MSDLDFAGLMDRLKELYDRGEYASALELASIEAGRFPERAASLFHARACLAARLGDSALAVRLLREALDADCWFPEFALRADEDLQLLAGLPEFEQVVTASVQKQTDIHARLGIKPGLLVLEPLAEPPHPLIIAFHSNNATVADSADFWRSATPADWMVALPESGQVSWLDRRFRAWFDLDWAEREVHDHWRYLTERHAVDFKRVVVAGFSRSGLLSIRAAVRQAIKATGFLVIGPAVRQSDLHDFVSMPLDRWPRDLRGYIILGGQDKWAPGTHALVDILRAHGVAVEVDFRPDMGHQFPPDFASSLTRGLEYLVPDRSTGTSIS